MTTADRALPSLAGLAARPQSTATETGAPKIESIGLNFYYGHTQALRDISVKLTPNVVTAFIGPSGCGKSTFLRSINRMNETIAGVHHSGDIRIDGASIYDKSVDVADLRRRVGMVFQRPNPFPQSIFDNVAFGPRVLGLAKGRAALDEAVRASLVAAGLWEEVEHRLASPAQALNPGQQQRLCIARAVATQPEIILMDEPCSALDPLATLRVEGRVLIDGTDIYDGVDVVELRRRVGMVFQKSNPFPK